MTTTDRELLERAAKAAGMYVGRDEGEWFYCVHGHSGSGLYMVGRPHAFWNAAINNDDAFHLGVSLDLFNHPRFLHERDVLMFTQKTPKLQATRLALVRAAAAMAGEGENKP